MVFSSLTKVPCNIRVHTTSVVLVITLAMYLNRFCLSLFESPAKLLYCVPYPAVILSQAIAFRSSVLVSRISCVHLTNDIHLY